MRLRPKGQMIGSPSRICRKSSQKPYDVARVGTLIRSGWQSAAVKKLTQKAESSLVSEARNASKQAYSPFSKVKVGAAILASDGRVFSGCNVENSSYGLSICAERTAAVKAVSEGAKSFLAVAVVSNLEGLTYPCGACRQFLSEFGAEMEVIVASDKEVSRHSLAELLPKGFLLRD
jgi:cytidine deaminase